MARDPWDDPTDEEVAEELQQQILFAKHTDLLEKVREHLKGLDVRNLRTTNPVHDELIVEYEVLSPRPVEMVVLTLDMEMSLNERLHLEMEVAEFFPALDVAHWTDEGLTEFYRKFVLPKKKGVA